MLASIQFDEFNAETLSDTLAVFGIAIVKNFLSAGLTEDLRSEVESATLDEPCVIERSQHANNEHGRVVIFDTAKLGAGQKTLASIFLSEDFHTLARNYFVGKEIKLNDQVYFTHEQHDERPILPWHFDRIQALKFYINLVDVDTSNGALGYCLKSHREGTLRANNGLLKGIPVHKLPNDVPESEIYNATDICAKAGDLVIFDAAGFHRGGIVQPGKERLVVRGHTHPVGVHKYGFARPLSAQWWARSPINISRLLARKIERQPTASDSQVRLTRVRNYLR